MFKTASFHQCEQLFSLNSVKKPLDNTSYNVHSLFLRTYPSKSEFWVELLRSLNFFVFFYPTTFNLSRVAALADGHNPLSKSVFYYTNPKYPSSSSLSKMVYRSVSNEIVTLYFLSCCNIRDAIFTFFKRCILFAGL